MRAEGEFEAALARIAVGAVGVQIAKKGSFTWWGGVEDIDDPKVEEGLKKLMTGKADAETKVKAIADALDKAGVKEPDLSKALAAIVASRDDADAILKNVRDRFEKAKYFDPAAAKDAVVKATDEPGERSTRVRQVDLELWKSVQHTAENQRRRRNAGIVGISEKVAKVVARRPLATDSIDRVQKYRPTQFLCLRIDVPKPPIV